MHRCTDYAYSSAKLNQVQYLFILVAVVIGFEMISYSINEPEIVGFTDLEVCMRLTVGALGMDLTLLVEWVSGRATGE